MCRNTTDFRSSPATSQTRSSIRSRAIWAIDYTPDLIIIQVTCVDGRSTDLRLELGRRIVDICAEVLGVPKRTELVEFTVHSGDEILRDGARAGEWTAAEASSLPSDTDERS